MAMSLPYPPLFWKIWAVGARVFQSNGDPREWITENTVLNRRNCAVLGDRAEKDLESRHGLWLGDVLRGRGGGWTRVFRVPRAHAASQRRRGRSEDRRRGESVRPLGGRHPDPRRRRRAYAPLL